MRKTKNNYVPSEYGGYLFPKDGSGGGGLMVYVDDPVFNAGGDILVGGTLDHTWNQINNALRNGIPVQIVAIHPIVADEYSNLIVIHVQAVYGPGLEYGYIIDGFSGSASYSFASESADGYPEYSDD